MQHIFQFADPTAPLMLTAAESLELSAVLGERSAFARLMDAAFSERRKVTFAVTGAQLAALRIVVKQTHPIEEHYSPTALVRKIEKAERALQRQPREFNQ